MAQLGFFLLPAAVAAVLIFGLARRVPLFSSFTAGAKDGLRACAAVLPPLVGLVTAVRMLQASGALDLFSTAAAPLAGALGFPVEAAPLASVAQPARLRQNIATTATRDRVLANFEFI